MDLSRGPTMLVAAVVCAAAAGLCLTDTNTYLRDQDKAPPCRSRSVANLPLTEEVLLRMRGTTRNHLMALMGGGEQGYQCPTLRFTSDMWKADAIAKFTFGPDGRVTLIQALSLKPDRKRTDEFIWMAGGPQCSDLAPLWPRCNRRLLISRPGEGAGRSDR